MSGGRWVEQRESAGPKLWEPTEGRWEGACVSAYTRTLAAAGIATWADVTGDDGSVLEWRECKRRWGLRESERGREGLREAKRAIEQSSEDEGADRGSRRPSLFLDEAH